MQDDGLVETYCVQCMEQREGDPPDNKLIAELLRGESPLSRNDRLMIAELLDPTFATNFFDWRLVPTFTGARREAEQRHKESAAWRGAERLKGSTAAAVEYLARGKDAPKLSYRSERRIYALAKRARSEDERRERFFKRITGVLLERIVSAFPSARTHLSLVRQKAASPEKSE